MRLAAFLAAVLAVSPSQAQAPGKSLAAADATVHPQAWPRVASRLPHDAALEARVQSLLSTLSVEDKVGQLIQADIAAIKPDDLKTYRLGSVLAGGNSGPNGNEFAKPAEWRALVDQFHRAALQPSPGHASIPLLFGIDAVHGNNNVVGATLFPQNSALGATRDPALIREIGAATAQEVRAVDIDWTFAPTLAVPQDDRWGRTYEGYSQDPQLVAQYASAMVEGLQGEPGGKDFLRAGHVVAAAKHFLGDGGTFEGRDQGDARVSEAVLRDVHGAGYVSAVGAGVQTVMASFSSWNGQKMHGNRALLTDVLKGRMGFDGFVVGDWNAHGQLEGCTNDSCAKAINAGVDMLMAPDGWRALYANTLAQVKSGEIPRARLDDAVSRILRVKLRAGLFEQGTKLPAMAAVSAIGAGDHRALARRAVRESLVLLKNRGGVLPIDPRRHVLVAGDGADNLSKQSGGWTITWQGTGVAAENFPNAQSIWSGIEQQVKAAGGTATLSVDGSFTQKPDVAIVVFGEEPYAEFQGDLKTFAYKPGNEHDLQLLRSLHARGVPVVAVFLAGRPLWVNREINASDAFVMAWLPGSEGGGVADVLLRKADGSVDHDFHGKLSYAWPRTAVQVAQEAGRAAQYPFGYGLTYADRDTAKALPEVSGVVAGQDPAGLFLERGKPTSLTQLELSDAAGGAQSTVGSVPAASPGGNVKIVGVDYKAQEDARRVKWSGAGGSLALVANAPLDLNRETNGDIQLVMTLRVDEVPAAGEVSLGVDCAKGCRARLPFRAALGGLPKGKWVRVGVPLKCFRDAGASMDALHAPFVIESRAPLTLSLSQVQLDARADTVLPCPAR
ncbi:1,4-beta-D-glucan glucohydrolase [Frateuria sp. Soil773]|uniref:glycoside hydrolase family 3 protein n=1 Tax=Frateuria sp. Soil773 TaxID=1736407 RepID=UPI0006FF620F|nr:exo 1,3/1,4-beta-D-glucan glucohydrolase [Frateuria sp. Soil773]KRE97860.1 1,4-beta-D-glucan glucohydrolase [Frateuria sp. Soil773]